ncbi:MAG TPA: hypothetical protein VK629_05240 [Steroidobacteraceae bacterium]|nr:hypothetical protein [Steroidobacteraceae bacterium]
MPISAIEPIDRRLARIQAALGLDPDGILGPETLTALESRLLKPRELEKSPYSLEVSKTGIDALVNFEVSSKAAYEKKYRKPIWPGGESGVTIGIGYDLGMTDASQIDSDWRGWLDDVSVSRLATAQGVTGEAARILAKTLADIEVPFDLAQSVFYRSTLPRFAKMTLAAFPGADALPGDAQAMLLSLVYNRGPGLSGPRRSHMAAIRPLVSGGVRNLDAIAEQFERMAVLWPSAPGLQTRRRKEAAMVRVAKRKYVPDELVRV